MKVAGTWTVDHLFRDRADAKKLFLDAKHMIESLGDVTMEVTKTQVSFRATKKFAWVWLPQLWTKNRPETSMTLTFDVGRKITNKRIAEVVEVRPGRWTHHVVIEKKSDLDGVIRKWLKEARQFADE